MNNLRAASSMTWLRLIGLCPLLAIDVTVVDTLLLGAALLITLLFTNSCTTLLQRWIPATQRLIAIALIAIVSAAIIDLLLQALCYSSAQTLQPYLPLLAIGPLLLYRTEISNSPTLSRALLDALLYGSAYAIALVIVALLRAPLPSAAGSALGLIGGALLLALANKITASHLDKSPPGPPATTPRTRARVTGPVR